LKANYEELSDNIATIAKIAEEIPARIEVEMGSLSAAIGKRGIFNWLRKS
jgi:hypothetical protein